MHSNHLGGTLPPMAPSVQAVVVDHNAFSGVLPTAPAGLLPGQSVLCPNAFELVPDPAWDAAVGQSPWWGAAGQCGDMLFANGFEAP